MVRKIPLIIFLVASSVLNCSVSQVLAQSAPNINNPNTSNPNTKIPELEQPLSLAASATVLFGVVNSNGTLSRGLGVVKSDNLGTGYYEVIFDRNVTKCAYNATLGRTDSLGTDGPGFVTVVGRYGNPNGVFLSTYDANSTLTDRSFHLSISCPSK